MKDVSRGEGRTVLFVSHNMGAVKSLCTSGLYLENGTLAFYKNSIEETVAVYLRKARPQELSLPIAGRKDRIGNGDIYITSFQLTDAINDHQIEIGRPLSFNVKYTSKLHSFQMQLLLSVNNINGDCILFLDSSTIANFPQVVANTGSITIDLPGNFGLPAGRYSVNIAALASGIMCDHVQNALVFDIVDGLFFGNGKMPVGKSLCLVKQDWEYKTLI
jgi:lipopolysaccharide transport system ATP-binding protein